MGGVVLKQEETSRDNDFFRHLLPVLKEAAQSSDRRVTRLALDVLIRAVVERIEAAG